MSAAALVIPRSVGLQLDFNHVYTYDGVEVPGVTHSLQQCKFIDYSGIPQRILDRAAERGKAVHLALEYLDNGTLDLDSVAPEYAGYLQGYQDFSAETGFAVLESETRKLHTQRRYAGTFDRLGMIGNDLVILDFKTGEVQPGHRLQLVAYAHFFPNPRRFRRIALQLFADGRKRVHEYAPSTFDYDTAVFFSAINCAHWRLQEMRNG